MPGRSPVFTPRPLRTDRLDLLPLLPAHADALAPVLADRALRTYTGGEPLDAPALRERYARWAAGSPDPQVVWANWAVRLREAEALVGTVQVTAGPGPAAEVAWVTGTAWQGRGIATEAATALVSELLRQGVPTVVAHVHPEHAASVAVASAAGLRPTPHWQDGERRWERTGGTS
ncbi:GNAT family N-acetyltransferase [Streptomyces sp. BBFR102]|uniref:GNAT family N-acetyltransferase n=1 Tax=Streptomyces sp. BBFR102 TaxID=3448171 RepID=UPI003F537E73